MKKVAVDFLLALTRAMAFKAPRKPQGGLGVLQAL